MRVYGILTNSQINFNEQLKQCNRVLFSAKCGGIVLEKMQTYIVLTIDVQWFDYKQTTYANAIASP